jgi:RNA polymerase sigma-70 factor (ECF subfamily)
MMPEMTEDPEAEYDQWFRACFPRAVTIARRVVGPENAEDAALEAFAIAFARWKRVRELPYRDGWVLKVAFHEALKHADRGEPRPQPADPYASSEDEVVLRRTLVQALLRLPRRQREAVALRYLVDLPEREVAAVLGLSTGTVKTHLHRGLTRLRAVLGPESLGGDTDGSFL